MLRIAVNALPLMAVHTGIARYLKTLYAHIGSRPDGDVMYVAPGHVSNTPPPGARQGGRLDKLLSLHPKVVYHMRAAQWIAYEKYAAYIAKRDEIDVFHESFYTPANIRKTAGQVFTLHDLSLVKHSHKHSLDRRMFFDRFFQSRFDQADHIIVPSFFVKEELLEYVAIPEKRVSVVHEGVDAQFSPQGKDVVSQVFTGLCLPTDYLLFVGTMDPRKNLPILLQALSRCKADLPLVVVGWSGWGDPKFQAELERLNMRNRVLFPGYVDDEDLPAIYSGATAFLYPSLYEGFGLPVLEAMACGCSVICSDAASIPEVAGEAALYANPVNPDEWANAIDMVVYDEQKRERLVSAGKARAALFAWKDAADQTMQILSGCRG